MAKKQETVTALKVAPGKHPEITYLPTDWSTLTGIVCGSDDLFARTEMTHLSDNVAALYNEAGPLLDLPGNRRVDDLIVAGTFFVVGVGGEGRIVSLPVKALLEYGAKFWEPEYYTDKEVVEAYFDSWLASIDRLAEM